MTASPEPSRPAHQRPWAAILAATVLILPLGSIYAFSVFLQPLEAMIGATRSQLATVFGICAVAYTIGMNIGPRLFPRLGVVPFLLLAVVIGAGGIALSAMAGSFPALAAGYGLLFGLGGGLCYVAAQQGVNLVGFKRSGLVNGYIVALLPCGAMLTAPACAWGIARFGVRETLWGLAAVILASGLVAIGLARVAGLRFRDTTAGAGLPGKPGRTNVFLKLFSVFFLSAAAGLMVLSQAAGIVAAYGGAALLATFATTGLSGAIAGARLIGGLLIDRLPIPAVMAGAQGVALAGATGLTLWPSAQASIGALLAIGMGYGIISGATAAAIAAYWPKALFGRVAARVYIAWCAAAVSLPVLAAHLFDLTGDYRTAFIIAGAANLLGAVLALTLPRQGPSSSTGSSDRTTSDAP